MINGRELNIRTRLNMMMNKIEANITNGTDFFKMLDTRLLFSKENYARDLRDFIYDPYPNLNIMAELDKSGIAFLMKPFDFYFIILWDKDFCQDMYKDNYKKMKEQGFKMNNTFLKWMNEIDLNFEKNEF